MTRQEGHEQLATINVQELTRSNLEGVSTRDFSKTTLPFFGGAFLSEKSHARKEICTKPPLFVRKKKGPW